MIIMNYVSTIPLNPRHANSIGFLSIPILTHALSAGSRKKLLCLNLIGNDGAEENRLKLEESLNLLGLDFQWSIEADFRGSVLAKTGALIDSKAKIENRVMLRCNCGKIFMPENFYLKAKKTNVLTENMSKCCSSKIFEEVNKTVFVDVQSLICKDSIPEMFPTSARCQFQDLLKSICTREKIILNKLYQTEILFREVFYDNDLFWINNFQILEESGIKVDIMVTGISTIRQVVLMYLFGGLKNIQKIYFVPKINFLPVHGVDTLEKIIKKFGAKKLNDTLVKLATNERQTCIFSGSMLGQP
jgi:hypothetical protein